MLKYFSLREGRERGEFAETHPFVSSKDLNDYLLVQSAVSEELRLSYLNQLTQLGLVRTDTSDQSSQTTFLGDLLLSYIGLGAPFEFTQDAPNLLISGIQPVDNVVSYLIASNRSWKYILKEIEKCEVRCANCHRRRTAQQLGWHKTKRTHDSPVS